MKAPKKAHRSVASLAAIAAAAAAVVLVPGTALASSGGGCRTTDSSNSDLEACISASGAYLEPDGYIISETGSCSTSYLILDDLTAGTTVAKYNIGCGTGHYGPFANKGVNGHEYSVELVSVNSSGSPLNSAWSYDETFSD